MSTDWEYDKEGWIEPPATAEYLWEQHHLSCPWYYYETGSCAVIADGRVVLRDCDHSTCPFAYWLTMVKK